MTFIDTFWTKYYCLIYQCKLNKRMSAWVTWLGTHTATTHPLLLQNFHCLLFFCFIASAIGEIAEPFISTLEQNQVAFFQFVLPEEGLTLRLEVHIGLVVLFASNKIQNPNEAFYDWKLETSSSADVYISLEGITKQQVLQFTNTTIFISIKGQSGVNNFTLNSTSGDTSTGMYNVPYSLELTPPLFAG